jgi:hypothetical protein
MKKVEEYRRHAEDCRQMAKRFTSPHERGTLLSMARTWESLAADREADIKRQERLAALEGKGRGGSIPVDQLNASNDE